MNNTKTESVRGGVGEFLVKQRDGIRNVAAECGVKPDKTTPQRFSINLYFGFMREWCWLMAESEQEAAHFARLWASQYTVKPTIKVYAL